MSREWDGITHETYVRLRERCRVAEAQRDSAEAYAERTREWAREGFAESRRLAERCSFLYGEAMKRGATHEDLRQPREGDET